MLCIGCIRWGVGSRRAAETSETKSCLVPVPDRSTHAATTEYLSDASGILQMYLRKGEKLPIQWGQRKKKKCEKQPFSTPVWEGWGIALQSRERPQWSRCPCCSAQTTCAGVCLAESCSPWKGSMLEQGKAAAEKGLYRLATFPCPAWGWGGERGVGKEVKVGMKRVTRMMF